MLKKLLAVLALCTATLGWAAVDVNKANEAELDAVKGIGPALTARILEERKKSPFKDWADLRGRVKGLGERNSARLSKAGLTVNGDPFQAAAADAAKPAKKGDKDKPTAAVAPKEMPKDASKDMAKADQAGSTKK